jgi:hypothetical protein
VEVTAGLKGGETVVVHPGDAMPEGTVVLPVAPAKDLTQNQTATQPTPAIEKNKAVRLEKE